MPISLKELKKNRLTPAEKWLLETIDGTKPKTLPDGYVKWGKNGKYLFIQDFKYGELYVVYSIWSDLKNDFGLSYNEVRQLLTNLLYDYTDNGKLGVNYF